MTLITIESLNQSLLAERICSEFGISKYDLWVFIITAPKRYKTYKIAKKNNKGSRIIAHPAVELKVIQRWLTENYLSSLPIHKSATAYEKNTSIKMNVEAHAKNSYLLKMDFEKFFPSIKPETFLNVLDLYTTDFNGIDKEILTRLLFWLPKGTTDIQLSIGAPSSPKISNIVMFQFDKMITEYCDLFGIAYTRYADDLAFSTNTPHILEGCHDYVLSNVVPHFKHLKINTEKTIFSSKKFNRRITGLVITNEGTVSLGREKKRYLRSKIHHFSEGKLLPLECETLKGELAFASSIEKSFVDRMKLKYGDIILEIQNF